MTVREWPRHGTGGAARWVRGLLVTLCAVVAVLLHHGLCDAPVTAMPTAGPHAMAAPVPVPAAQPRTGPPATGPVAPVAHGSDGAACPSMDMQVCMSAGANAVQLTAPPESPMAAFPVRTAELTGVDIARSVHRAPPDLSLLSLLRI
jgi:hypothetical protein